MKKAVYTTCAKCGARGPEGELAPAALQQAASQGWLIGDRPHSKLDYCPACRLSFEQHPCIVRHAGKQSSAIYQMDVPDREPLYTCGLHAQQVIRELFSSDVDSVTLTRTTARRRVFRR